MKKLLVLLFLGAWAGVASASWILIPMNNTQKNHLKAYGITYWVLSKGGEANWLLNYEGGSFLFPDEEIFQKECRIRGVSYDIISDNKYYQIQAEIADPEVNMEWVQLLKPPKIAVYSPKTKQPWDDAVTMVLTFAEIPYDVVFDDEVMEGKLPLYDWLHLHHEDFTGQHGKFYAAYRHAAWYQDEVREAEAMAAKYGFAKVSELKLAVSKKIRDFVSGGGFLFAMCSATDSYDIALAAEGLDIVPAELDGDACDFSADKKLSFDNSFAFQKYKLSYYAMEYEFSSIDATEDHRNLNESNDKFVLFDFSAKFDMIPTILNQNHTRIVSNFYGQTTGFRKQYLKPGVTVLGESKQINEAKYIHGTYGKGTWTFFGGHDPEDYQHQVGEPPSDLSLHPNSPGYRLILNNILFPSAKKKKMKT